MNLILLGPPGSGKGTQGVFLHEELSIPSISTGSILREACKNKTPLGDAAQEYMTTGRLVPDQIVIGIVEERISREDCKTGYILDGFPRTLRQAQALTELLQKKNDSLHAVINFDVPHDELVKRLTGRRVCTQCGSGFHIYFSPPSQPDVCDRCGGALLQREDDKVDTINNRLEIYKTQTEPLISYYQQEGLLRNIHGLGEAREIFERVAHSLGLSSVEKTKSLAGHS